MFMIMIWIISIKYVHMFINFYSRKLWTFPVFFWGIYLHWPCRAARCQLTSSRITMPRASGSESTGRTSPAIVASEYVRWSNPHFSWLISDFRSVRLFLIYCMVPCFSFLFFPCCGIYLYLFHSVYFMFLHFSHCFSSFQYQNPAGPRIQLIWCLDFLWYFPGSHRIP